MAQIILKNGGITTIDDRDVDRFRGIKWLKNRQNYVYRKVQFKKKVHIVWLHREILGVPEGFFADHIDGNPLNNKRNNLRICTHQQNSFNQKSRRGFKGATWIAKRKVWQAQCKHNYKTKWLGYHKTLSGALDAYDNYVTRHWGEFSRPNKGRSKA